MSYLQIEHFSHHHVLDALKLDEGEEVNCDACEEDITEPYHGCIECKYYLHDDCLDTPRSLAHHSHPSHPLTFHLTPTYSCRLYTCNACGSEGNGFSFSCALCEFDIHLRCATLPTSLLTDKHPHEQTLFFGSPYSDENAEFACDVCRAKMNPHQWLYYCADCDFATHLDCAKGKPRTKKNPKKGKGKAKSNMQEARKIAESASSQAKKAVEDIKAISLAEDEIYAAAVKGRIEAHTQQAILDLWDSPPRRRRDYYY